MDKTKKQLIEKALRTYKRIFVIPNRSSFDECFTREEDSLLFWFNTEDKTTHVLISLI